MAFNLGVNVLEVDGRAAPAIERAPISTAGFLVRSQRGVPNAPVQITSFRDFQNNFGSYRDDAFGAHVVRGFFENGGSEAYAVRVLDPAAVPAAAVLNTAGGAGTLQVVAGMRGRRDPGTWANGPAGGLSVLVVDHPRGESAIPAQIVGAGPGEPYNVAAPNNVLSLTVNGASAPVTLTLPAADFANPGAASAAEVAAAINRRTTAVRAGVTPNQRLLLASATPGTLSRLVVTGSAAANLGFTGGTANSDANVTDAAIAVHSPSGFPPRAAVRIETPGHIVGTGPIAAGLAANSGIVVTPDTTGAPVTVTFTDADFANGIGAVTPGEVVAAINRVAAGFFAGLTAQGRLVIASTTYGTGSAIAVAAGPGGDARANLGLTGAAPLAPLREFSQLTAASEAYKQVTLASAPGSAVPHVVARIQSVEFDLVVWRGGVEVERLTSLSMQNQLDYHVEAVVNDAALGSRYVLVEDLNLNTPGADAPRTTAPADLVGGTEGTLPTDAHYVGDSAARTGLYALDTVDIQLLACPETQSQGVAGAAIAYCEGRGDAMFVGTAPRGYDRDAIKTYAGALRGRKVYGALYAPWIEIINPLDTTGNNPRLTVPPVGHVLGAYARIGEARGVWKAPAGDEATLAFTLGTEFEMTDANHTDLVKEGGVNAIRAVRGAGIIVDSSRTLSTDSRWLYVGTRRLFNFVKSSLRDGLRWVPQEPHDDNLRRRVKFNVITPFLLGLWQQGAFGSDPAELVFTVRCDETNNPPAEVALGNFKVEVFFYPVKPAETIVLVVGQQEAGGAAAEA